MSNKVHDESIVRVSLWLRDWEELMVLLDVWLAQRISRVAERGELNYFRKRGAQKRKRLCTLPSLCAHRPLAS